MATTGMWSVKSRLDHLVNYVSNPLKTVTQYVINEEKMMEKRYVTCINCSFDNPKESMEKTKKQYFRRLFGFFNLPLPDDPCHRLGEISLRARPDLFLSWLRDNYLVYREDREA